MALSEIDRKLLQRCLDSKPGAWEDFVERYLGLVVHVINHTAQSRSIVPTPADVDDLASDVFLAIVDDDFAVLRRFRGESSLATYLTVVARRVVVREMLKRRSANSLAALAERGRQASEQQAAFEERISNREEIERLLQGLDSPDADVVRLYHLEGKSYREISHQVGMPENSIGPTLSRARAKMRQLSDDRAARRSLRDASWHDSPSRDERICSLFRPQVPDVARALIARRQDGSALAEPASCHRYPRISGSVAIRWGTS